MFLPLGGTFVYLLYVDESGLPNGSGTKSFVLAGVALHEDDVYPLGQHLDAVFKRVLPTEHHGLELHASPIISGREAWSKVDKSSRLRLLDQEFQALGTWRSPGGRKPVLFAVAVHKGSFPGRSIVDVAYEQLLARFDHFLLRRHREGDSHRSLVISDESSYEQSLQSAMQRWKSGKGVLKQLHTLVEVPLFVDSRASRLVQGADLVAWSVFNYYERGHSTYLSHIYEHFDAQEGEQHGMVHLVKEYRTCGCSACGSRRLFVVPPSLPPSSVVAVPLP